MPSGEHLLDQETQNGRVTLTVRPKPDTGEKGPGCPKVGWEVSRQPYLAIGARHESNTLTMLRNSLTQLGERVSVSLRL